MKITTEVPEPLPVTWHLELTDDEMAELYEVVGCHIYTDLQHRRVWQLFNDISPATGARLHDRAARLREV